jgi:putative oxidoreductase
MNTENHSKTTDLGLLALRLTTGGLIAGHGAQKLFGSFGGHGLKGTTGFMESLGLKPSKQWAALAGASEFGSGLLTALGFGGPIGPISMYGPMLMAWTTAHAGKPIWVTSGGAELPLVFISNAAALVLIGPGRYSLDKALGIKIPAIISVLTAAGVIAGIAAGHLMREQAVEEQLPATDRPAEPASDNQTEIAKGESVEEFKAREVGDTAPPADNIPQI